MKFIIEFDGILSDVRCAYCEAHRRVAESLGWSRLDDATLWRTVRSKGRDGVYLRGARAGLVEKYHPAFAEECERDEVLAKCSQVDGMADCLSRLSRHGVSTAITIGSDTGIRRSLADAWSLLGALESFEGLNSDPRRRPGELVALSGGDRRTLVVASSDTIIRAAAQTDFLKIGISTGACSVRRLHQAGADLVYGDLIALADSLDAGAADLIEAGLLPEVGRTL